MMRRSLVVVLFILSASLAGMSLLPSASAATLYVGGAGPGNYTTIRSAIDAASSGDTVYVYSGTYHETVQIPKPITLRGEDRDTTIIDGTRADIIRVNADGVTVTGFTISGSGPTSSYKGVNLGAATNSLITGNRITSNYFGIYVLPSSDNTISDNIVSDHRYGIYVGYSSGNVLLGNTVSDNLEGIVLFSATSTTLTGNEMIGDGISIHGLTYELEYWNTHEIDTSNTVDGKPVYYWKDTAGGTVPPGAGQVILANCSNVVVENQDLSRGDLGIHLAFSSSNTIRGNTASNNSMKGIFIVQSHNNTFADNVASHNGVGIDIWYSENNTIINSVASYNTAGISLLRAEGNSVLNTTILSNVLLGIQSSGSCNATMSGNTLAENGIFIWGDSKEYWNTHDIDDSNTVNGKPVYYWKNVVGGKIPPGAGQVILANSTDVIVENQDVSHGTAGITIGFSERITVANTTSSNQRWYGAYVWGSPWTTLTNTTALGNRYGFRLHDSENSIVSNSTVVSNDYFGIAVSQNSEVVGNTVTHHNGTGIGAGSNSIVSDNTVSYNEYGISVGSSSQVTWNDVSFNEYGIYVSSSNALVSHNQVYDNSKGIFIGGSSNSILYNVVHSNSAEGIWIESSLYNTIAGNTISYNGLGLHSYFYCEGNEIYHNNFINNTEQAFEDRGSNQWDNGYPSGGNYWSDYTGVDEKSGPDQNQPGGDGIGDSPYMIPYYDWDPVDPKDRYPLMEPFVAPPAPPSAPWDLQAVAGFMRIELRWQPPRYDGGSPITNYTIYRGFAPDAETFLVEVGNVTTYVDTGLVMGKTYYYRVAAKNTIGEGPKSNEANATVPVALRPPLDDVRVPWTNISLNWTGPQPHIPGMGPQMSVSSSDRGSSAAGLIPPSRYEPSRKPKPVELDDAWVFGEEVITDRIRCCGAPSFTNEHWEELSTSRPGTRRFSRAR